jgi:hypothetical protein
MRRHIATLLLTAALIGTAGCAGSVRFYDAPRHEYHRWDAREDRAYRAYLSERHLQYREFRRLDPREQEAYWQWRHEHPDRDQYRR